MNEASEFVDQPETTAAQAQEDQGQVTPESVVEKSLVEDVSIDGMCGVY